jgi:amino acid transporter
MKTIKFLRNDVPIRMILFFFIGFIYVFYFFVSVVFFEKLANSSQVLIPVFVFFWILYPLVYFLLTGTINSLKKFCRRIYIFNKEEDEQKRSYEEKELTKIVLFDVIGYYSGAVIAGFIIVIIAVIAIFILLGRGIIWLAIHPNPWGILAIIVSLLVFLTFLTYRRCREFNDFLYSLSFFPDFKI